ncbi:hypothetical protein YC2023_064488 [Brassica napus]
MVGNTIGRCGSDHDGGRPQDNRNDRDNVVSPVVGRNGDNLREDPSPIDDDYQPNRASPRGSKSP